MTQSLTLVRRSALLSVASVVLACSGVETSGDGVSGASLASSPKQVCDSVAPVPQECAAPKLAKQYQLGWKKGSRLVSKAWERFGSCDEVEQFADSVLAELDLSQAGDDAPEEKPAKLCRYAGTLDSVFVALDSVQQSCDAECFMDGELVGTLEATAYCELVIDAAGELDPELWIRSPVAVCGFEFEVACDAEFLGVTLSYANASGVCEPYVHDPYFEIWDRSRLKSCDYYNYDD